MTENKRNSRRMSFWIDVLHLVIGAAVILLSVMAFLAPEKHPVFFPLIFLLAAVLTMVNGVIRFRYAGRDGKRRLAGAAAAAAGLLLLVLAGISAAVML